MFLSHHPLEFAGILQMKSPSTNDLQNDTSLIVTDDFVNLLIFLSVRLVYCLLFVYSVFPKSTKVDKELVINITKDTVQNESWQ